MSNGKYVTYSLAYTIIMLLLASGRVKIERSKHNEDIPAKRRVHR